MFADWEDYGDENEELDLVKRYTDFRDNGRTGFFDADEYECIIDHFINEYNYRDGLSAISMALSQHPLSVSVRLRHTQILIETGKPAKALRIIKRIEQFEQYNYHIFLFKGISLLLTGRKREASFNFKKAISLSGENRDDTGYSIAQSFIQVDMYEEAIDYLLLSHESNENNFMTIYELAQCYNKTGLHEKSILYFRKYIDIDPFAENVWNNLGQVYSKSGEFEMAKDAFDFAIAINPNFYSAYLNKADVFVLMNDFGNAVALLNDNIERDPENLKAICALADCYQEMEEYKIAVDKYDKVLSIFSGYSDALFGKAVVLYKLKKFGQAVASIKQALEIEPDNPDYWFILAEVYTRQKKFNAALEAYQKTVQINPLDHEAWLACAQLLFSRRKINEAIEFLGLSYKHINNNPTLHFRLAAYYTYSKNFTEAGKHFEKGLSLNYQEYKEMFRQFPKTKGYSFFYNIIEKHIGADHKYYTI